MILGGAGRSIGRIARFTTSKMPKMPRMDGTGDGTGDGGDGGDATPAPEPEDDGEGNPLMMLWKTYNEKLESDPLIMKMLTSFTGFLLGDIIAQTCIEKKGFDWFRLFRLSSFGFLIHGSTSHYFYGFLDGKIPGTTAPVVAGKVFIDQVLWNPIFGVMFFGYVAALEQKGFGYVVDKVKNELMSQVTGSWKVWPLAHTINFRFIPSSQRVLYINTIQIGYNCFLSILAGR
jgi:protein Mpv17